MMYYGILVLFIIVYVISKLTSLLDFSIIRIYDILGNRLIVKQLDVLVQECLQQGHILRLALDDVAEEEVGSIWE